MVAPEALTAARRYAELAAPHVEAVYLTGSATLGDWVPGVSDIDLVALSRDTVDRETLIAIHRAVRRACPEPVFDVLYLRRGDLARAPSQAGPRPFWNAGRLIEDAALVSPVTWHGLADHGLGVAGAPPLRGVHRDDPVLRRWCQDNLSGYWSGWATRGASPTTRDGMTLLTDWGIAWCVLGVLRLRYTIATGRITSKSAAGRWGLGAMGAGDRPLIEEALAARSAPLAPPADRRAADARRAATVAFMRRVIADR